MALRRSSTGNLKSSPQRLCDNEGALLLSANIYSATPLSLRLRLLAGPYMPFRFHQLSWWKYCYYYRYKGCHAISTVSFVRSHYA